MEPSSSRSPSWRRPSPFRRNVGLGPWRRARPFLPPSRRSGRTRPSPTSRAARRSPTPSPSAPARPRTAWRSRPRRRPSRRRLPPLWSRPACASFRSVRPMVCACWRGLSRCWRRWSHKPWRRPLPRWVAPAFCSTLPRCGTKPNTLGYLGRDGATMAKSPNGPLRVGIGGPVGSGKTALMEALCKAFRDRYEICAITNDIYTKEDALILTRAGALPEQRILGVETGGCPHTAIREDASINLAAVAQMQRAFPDLDLVLIESGGDNLAATFSPELADLTIYVIDVAQGEKIPRKGGPGITRSDLLVINKTDLAPYVGASLAVMASDSKRMRGERPFVFSNLKTGDGVASIASFVENSGGLV